MSNFPVANFHVVHVGKTASKRGSEVSRSALNGKMTKNLTSYTNDLLGLCPPFP